MVKKYHTKNNFKKVKKKLRYAYMCICAKNTRFHIVYNSYKQFK